MDHRRLGRSGLSVSKLWRSIEVDVEPTCEKAGISQIVWSPIAQGVLTGKYLPGAPLPAASRGATPGAADFVRRLLRDDILERVQGLRPVAADVGVTMAELAVAWVPRDDNIAAAIIGASRPEQLRENVAAAGIRLSDDVLARIDELLGDVVVRDHPAG